MNEIKDYEKFHTKSIIHKSLNTLEGLLKGIKADKEINLDETNELKNWLANNSSLFSSYPFKEILDCIELSLDDNILETNELDDILWLCENFKKIKENEYYDMITSDIQVLNGILYGIISDNVIKEEELHELNDWLTENEQLKNTYPYEEVYSLLTGILADGKVTEHEKDILKVFFSDFIDTTTSYNINKKEMDELKKSLHVDGICSVDPEIEIKDNVFCFTGKSSRTSRTDFANLVADMGGIYKDTVTKETKYLIVGNECNPCWAFSCYGRKIQKAMDLRKKGSNILIVHENDFWDTIS